MAGKPFRTENLLAAINREVLHKKAPMQRSHPFISKSDQSARVTNKSIATNKTKNKNNKKTNSSVKQKSVVTKNTRVAISDSSTPIKHWIWPVNGKVISRFSNRSNMNKGLDIAAKKGTPVRATAKGRVVYSGRGLRGYGQLVIIKHNDQFLSAYAHNDKIHVEENEVVKAGQRIAELGNTDSDKDKLHFEIRLKGKPVDPLNYLPKSGLM
ncbi:MAG: peptidoglycan DD-metalloendopeptidase family protein [Kangiellaceae bacterium]|nr:peptidoglycan DD-metalloendopeptidase family protein [Kangiellaceae bacterium]